MGITMKKNQHAREMGKRMGDRAERQERARLIKQAEAGLPRREERTSWYAADGQGRTIIETEYANGRPVRVKRHISQEEVLRRQRKFRRQQTMHSVLAPILGFATLGFNFVVLFVVFLGIKLSGLVMIGWGVWDMFQHHSINNGWAWFWVILGLVLFLCFKASYTVTTTTTHSRTVTNSARRR